MMILTELAIISFIVALHSGSGSEVSKADHEWDIIIFTQHWPVTVCHQWQTKNPSNKCVLPTLTDIWTVHGLWPTKFGTIGPQYCNSSWKFDPSQLYPLEKQLEIYWLNIEKNTPLYSFWKHEWKRHGTCALSLPALDSESKYFGKGLNLISKYNMRQILEKGNVVPGTAEMYKPEQIYNAVKNVLMKNPTLECVHDKNSNISYISEIRICLDKTFDVVDCDGIKNVLGYHNHKILSNCDLNKPVFYPSVLPNPPSVSPEQPDDSYLEHLHTVLEIYKFLNLLRWFTF